MSSGRGSAASRGPSPPDLDPALSDQVQVDAGKPDKLDNADSQVAYPVACPHTSLQHAVDNIAQDTEPYHKLDPDVWDSPEQPVDIDQEPLPIPSLLLRDPNPERPDYVELEFPGDSFKILSDLPKTPGTNETVVLRVYASGIKRSVIERDSDALTQEEMHT